MQRTASGFESGVLGVPDPARRWNDQTNHNPLTDSRALETGIRDRLAAVIGRGAFREWFSENAKLRVVDCRLHVDVATPFLQKALKRKLGGAISCVARDVLGPAAEVEFVVNTNLEASTPKLNGATAPAKPATGAADAPPVGRRFRDFSDYVVGTSNSLAMTGAQHVCQSPGGKYNPLFVHGSCGTGKTHFLEAIYCRIRREHPRKQVIYLQAEGYANYFTEALRNQSMPAFRNRFRGVDVLLIDDAGFFDNKPGIQGEFLHTFQHLIERGKQIVISCDRHPRLLSNTSEDLITRFLGGLLCKLDCPDDDQRLAIVEQKAAKMSLSLQPGVIEYLVKRFKRNVRELEGALNCVGMHQEAQGKRLSPTAAANVLGELERDCLRVIRLVDIEEAVGSLFGVSADDLRSATRVRTVAQPRAVAMYVARQCTGAAYSEIGRHFGGRNHSTVLSAERRVTRWIDEDAEIRVASRAWRAKDVVMAIEQRLEAG